MDASPTHCNALYKNPLDNVLHRFNIFFTGGVLLLVIECATYDSSCIWCRGAGATASGAPLRFDKALFVNSTIHRGISRFNFNFKRLFKRHCSKLGPNLNFIEGFIGSNTVMDIIKNTFPFLTSNVVALKVC